MQRIKPSFGWFTCLEYSLLKRFAFVDNSSTKGTATGTHAEMTSPLKKRKCLSGATCVAERKTTSKKIKTSSSARSAAKSLDEDEDGDVAMTAPAVATISSATTASTEQPLVAICAQTSIDLKELEFFTKPRSCILVESCASWPAKATLFGVCPKVTETPKVVGAGAGASTASLIEGKQDKTFVRFSATLDATETSALFALGELPVCVSETKGDAKKVTAAPDTIKHAGDTKEVKVIAVDDDMTLFRPLEIPASRVQLEKTFVDCVAKQLEDARCGDLMHPVPLEAKLFKVVLMRPGDHCERFLHETDFMCSDSPNKVAIMTVSLFIETPRSEFDKAVTRAAKANTARNKRHWSEQATSARNAHGGIAVLSAYEWFSVPRDKSDGGLKVAVHSDRSFDVELVPTPKTPLAFSTFWHDSSRNVHYDSLCRVMLIFDVVETSPSLAAHLKPSKLVEPFRPAIQDAVARLKHVGARRVGLLVSRPYSAHQHRFTASLAQLTGSDRILAQVLVQDGHHVEVARVVMHRGKMVHGALFGGRTGLDMSAFRFPPDLEDDRSDVQEDEKLVDKHHLALLTDDESKFRTAHDVQQESVWIKDEYRLGDVLFVRSDNPRLHHVQQGCCAGNAVVFESLALIVTLSPSSGRSGKLQRLEKKAAKSTRSMVGSSAGSAAEPKEEIKKTACGWYSSVVASTICDMDGWPRSSQGACMWHHCLITRAEFDRRHGHCSTDGVDAAHSIGEAMDVFALPDHEVGASKCCAAS
jgi:hypothetical protein